MTDPRDENEALGLRLAFDTDDPSFARGFELGRAWEMLNASDEPVEMIVHDDRAEMLLRMGEATGRQVQTSPLGGAWVTVRFGESGQENDGRGLSDA